MPDFIAVDEINSQVITSESNIVNKTSDTFNIIKNDTNTLLNISNKLITQPSVTYEKNVTNKVHLISKPEKILNKSFDKTFVSTNTTFVVNTSFIQSSDKEQVYVDITDEPGTDILARDTYYRSGLLYSSLVVSNATIGKTYKVSIHGEASSVNSCTVENLDSSLYDHNKYLVSSPITSSNSQDIKQIGSFHSEGYGTLNLIYSVNPDKYTLITVNKNGVSNIASFSTRPPDIEGTKSSTYLATIPVEYNDDLVFFFQGSKNASINYARLSTSIINTQGTNTIKRIQRGVAYANTGNSTTYEITIAPCNPQKSLCLLNSSLPLQQLNYANLIVGDTTNQKGTVSYQIIEFY